MQKWIVLGLVGLVTLPACASLGDLSALGRLVQPPRFSEAPGRRSEVRFVAPSRNLPLGGAVVRVWSEIHNPNPFGFTLSTLAADVILDGSHAATANFPLGLPLEANERSEVPLDLSISFANVPELADSIGRAVRGDPVPYELRGTIGVDAGRFGQPTFGPMSMLRGELLVVR